MILMIVAPLQVHGMLHAHRVVALHAVVWYVPAAHTKQAVGAVLPATQKLLAGQLVWVAGVGQ